jgi:hypothetical protein
VSRARELAVSRLLADRCYGISIASGPIGSISRAQGRAPDAKDNGLDDSRPKQQNAANECNRTQTGDCAARNKYEAPEHHRRRNDPEEPRVFDGFITF